jgi:hypothetical protein
MSTCPEGHDTASTDFCDVCGIRVGAPAPAQAGPAAAACPRCGAERSGQFCETCGYSFAADCPERRFPLRRPEMRIGRRSSSRGLEPEIDLTGPPLDPGVSHLHAVLTAEPDGGWTVCDPGSANGTLVNGQALPAGARVRLRDGDRVSVGAWTVLTIQAA